MEEKLTALKTAKYIWIYGAGNIGKRVLKILSNDALKLSLKGVVVSERGDINDQKIYEIGEINTPESESIFVIAVSPKFQQEIIDNLRENGYLHYIIWKSEYASGIWRLVNYRFDDRSQKTKKVCFVLSGYKEFLWKDTFERLWQFAPKDLDICILSSGVRNEKLVALAQRNGWSYLSTEINDVSMIQNLAFELFSHAEWIYKMDEDIFLTEGCFDRLFQLHLEIEKNKPYRIGFSAPLINVNGYGYLRILDYLGKIEDYEERFGRAFYGAHSDSMIESNVYAAKYMWGQDENIPQLDNLGKILEKSTRYSICGVRFSIGFILMNRKVWKDMGGFTVTGRLDLGADERELCQYCIVRSLVIAVAENTVVGHFSFGKQTLGMRQFYGENPELFQIN